MTPAIDFLTASNETFQLHSFPSEGRPGFAVEAATALGLDPGRVFKTLIASDEARRHYVALVPAHRMLDIKQLARLVGVKRIAMASTQAAQNVTGYLIGAISPFGQRQRLPLFADHTLTAFASVYVSGGRRGLEIEIDPQRLIALTEATVGPIAR